MAKRQINYALLEKVKMRLKRLRHPRHFDMNFWSDKTECGTTACIAGHGLLISGKMTPVQLLKQANLRVDGEPEDWFSPVQENAVYQAAVKEFGLTQAQADRLFFYEEWPESFRVDYEDAMTPSERRDIAVKRIEHFIQTQGQE